MTQQKALQQGSRQNAVYTVQCCSAKQAHSRQRVTAVTPMEICSSNRCAVTQQKALQQGSGQSAVYTVQCCSAKQAHSRQCVTAVTRVHRDVPFIQVCRDPHQLWSCSTARGKMQFPISCVAVQDRLTACIVSLQIHLWRLALRTGVQGSNTNAHTGVQ